MLPLWWVTAKRAGSSTRYLEREDPPRALGAVVLGDAVVGAADVVRGGACR